MPKFMFINHHWAVAMRWMHPDPFLAYLLLLKRDHIDG